MWTPGRLDLVRPNLVIYIADLTRSAIYMLGTSTLAKADADPILLELASCGLVSDSEQTKGQHSHFLSIVVYHCRQVRATYVCRQ